MKVTNELEDLMLIIVETVLWSELEIIAPTKDVVDCLRQFEISTLSKQEVPQVGARTMLDRCKAGQIESMSN